MEKDDVSPKYPMPSLKRAAGRVGVIMCVLMNRARLAEHSEVKSLVQMVAGFSGAMVPSSLLHACGAGGPALCDCSWDCFFDVEDRAFYQEGPALSRERLTQGS